MVASCFVFIIAGCRASNLAKVLSHNQLALSHDQFPSFTGAPV